MEELLIEVDEKNQEIGLRPRSEFFQTDHIHRAVHLLLLDDENKVTLQLRSADKKWYPNLYTFSVSGCVGNKSYDECMSDELREELGIQIATERVLDCPYFDNQDKAWHRLYMGKTSRELHMDPAEAQGHKKIALEGIRSEIMQSPDIYTPIFVTIMHKFFKEHYEKIRQKYKL